MSHESYYPSLEANAISVVIACVDPQSQCRIEMGLATTLKGCYVVLRSVDVQDLLDKGQDFSFSVYENGLFLCSHRAGGMKSAIKTTLEKIFHTKN